MVIKIQIQIEIEIKKPVDILTCKFVLSKSKSDTQIHTGILYMDS